jgi:hypothetical protein
MDVKNGMIDLSEEIGELRESIDTKPCLKLGYCPYGVLVEGFQLPSIARKEAVDHNEYLKKALAEGTFDNPNRRCLMSREDAEQEIAAFDENEYPEEPDQYEWGVCGVVGHYCPVMYVAEPFVDDDGDNENDDDEGDETG